MFIKAEKRRSKLRIGITGVSGSGKTLSSLILAKGMGGKTAMIDTENGSGSLYADHELLKGWSYDVLEITPDYTPEKYIKAIEEAEKMGYDNLVIDSLSHVWTGSGGVLSSVDKYNNTVANSGWRTMSPRHNALIDKILTSSLHIIVTMRDKTEYSYEKDPQSGKVVPKKIGLAPVQRPDMEYEFTVVLDISRDGHLATIQKNRTTLWQDEVPFIVTEETGKEVIEWLNSGAKPRCQKCLTAEATKEADNRKNYCDSCFEKYEQWKAKKNITNTPPATEVTEK